jgi:hypothetical protein
MYLQETVCHQSSILALRICHSSVGFLRIAKVEDHAISCPGIGACFQWAPMDVDTCRLCVGTRGLTLRLTRTESTAVELEQFVLMFATALFFNISKISLKSV